MVTLTSETPSSIERFETKPQTKFVKYDQVFRQEEEEFMEFKVKSTSGIKRIDK